MTSHFTQALGQLLAHSTINKRDWAKASGIDEGSFSRLTKGKLPVGAKTVARLCSVVGRDDGARLLKAYLLDETEKVRAACGNAPIAKGPIHLSVRLPE